MIRISLLGGVSLFALAHVACARGQVTPLPRQRISLNAAWRFHKGDPPGYSTAVLYDVRPEVKEKQDDRAADAEPEVATTATAPAHPVLKPWILTSGDPFIKNPARRHVRPAGESPS